MAFVFIHSADWQLGKPFGGFDIEKQALLRQARLEAIDRLADAAHTAGAGHVLVAGDIYDGDVGDHTLAQPLDRMGAHNDLHWHLLPGNHDPAGRGGIWDRVRTFGPAENVIIHDEARPLEVQPGVHILPAPLFGKTASSDPTGWMDEAVTPDGAIRIGLAHGSIRGFDSAGDASVEVSPGRDVSAGLAYLALGDWHGQTRISERVWYSGTPEPDRFKDNKSGRALMIRLESAGALPIVENVETAAFKWHQRSASLQKADDLATVEQDVRDWGVARGRSLLQLELSGALTLGDYAQVEQRLDRLSTGLFHLERRLDQLHSLTGAADLELIGDGNVQVAARRLQQIASDENDERAPVAEQALRRLFVLSIEVRRAAGGDE